MKSLTACIFTCLTLNCVASLKIFWVDVEGGAATLLVTPAKESILIDTGLPGDRDAPRINKLARDVAGLERIDHLVITHFDLDHFGGAADLSKLIPIGTIYDNGGAPAERLKKLHTDYLTMRNDINYRVLKPGDTLPLKQTSTAFEAIVLASNRKFIDFDDWMRENGIFKEPPPRKNEDTSRNGNSIVVHFKLGDFDFLDGGDLTWNLEEQLVYPRNRVGVVDVFQANHHGLDSSNNPALVQSIEPTVVVFNNGDRKGCGPVSFQTARNTPSVKAIYQVHKNLRKDGNINNAPDEYIANKSKKEECSAHHIALETTEDGSGYSIFIPSTKHKAGYASKP